MIPKAIDRVALALRTGITYKEAWNTLAMCFGERMQNEELELMDAVLSGVKLDLGEGQDETRQKGGESVPNK